MVTHSKSGSGGLVSRGVGGGVEKWVGVGDWGSSAALVGQQALQRGQWLLIVSRGSGGLVSRGSVNLNL